MADSQVIGSTSFVPEDLATLIMGGRFRHIPLTGWSESHAGTGSATQIPLMIQVNSGSTNGSVGRAYLAARAFSPGGLYNYWNYAKKLVVVFDYIRGGNDAGSIHHLWICNSTVVGNMPSLGLGIKLLKDALYGESYGTALGQVDLSYTMPSYMDRIAIILYPGLKIEWYVNGALKGTQTDTTKVPSGNVTSMNISMASKNNAGSIDCWSRLAAFQIWQEQ